MPLISANYSGGIIITDWYSDGKGTGESIKVSIRFLTNEIRSDALDIKVFMKKCKDLNNCIVSETKGVLILELILIIPNHQFADFTPFFGVTIYCSTSKYSFYFEVVVKVVKEIIIWDCVLRIRIRK